VCHDILRPFKKRRKGNITKTYVCA
jgi:hypothetical protein